MRLKGRPRRPATNRRSCRCRLPSPGKRELGTAVFGHEFSGLPGVRTAPRAQPSSTRRCAALVDDAACGGFLADRRRRSATGLPASIARRRTRARIPRPLPRARAGRSCRCRTNSATSQRISAGVRLRAVAQCDHRDVLAGRAHETRAVADPRTAVGNPGEAARLDDVQPASVARGLPSSACRPRTSSRPARDRQPCRCRSSRPRARGRAGRCVPGRRPPAPNRFRRSGNPFRRCIATRERRDRGRIAVDDAGVLHAERLEDLRAGEFANDCPLTRAMTTPSKK